MRIDRDRALQIVRDVVAERGEDYIYTKHFPNCQYQYAKSTPKSQRGACLVGKGLIDLGVKFWVPKNQVGRLRGVEGAWGSVESDGRIEGMFTPEIVETLKIANPDLEITDGARRVLRAAQSAQDDGDTYREALSCAENEHTRCVILGVE